MHRLLLLPLLLALPAAAKPAGSCTPAHAGEVACMEGRLCRCGLAPGGSLTGEAGGWRWDCGVLRPSCGPLPPAGVGAGPAPLPGLLLHLPPARSDPRPR